MRPVFDAVQRARFTGQVEQGLMETVVLYSPGLHGMKGPPAEPANQSSDTDEASELKRDSTLNARTGVSGPRQTRGDHGVASASGGAASHTRGAVLADEVFPLADRAVGTRPCPGSSQHQDHHQDNDTCQESESTHREEVRRSPRCLTQQA